MSSIQDIRALELQITDIVDDYVEKRYNEDDVLAIGRRCGKITVKAPKSVTVDIDQDTRTVRCTYKGKTKVFALK